MKKKFKYTEDLNEAIRVVEKLCDENGAEFSLDKDHYPDKGVWFAYFHDIGNLCSDKSPSKAVSLALYKALGSVNKTEKE